MLIRVYRSSCGSYRGVLLAQNILGLCDEDVRSGCQAIPHITDHKSHPGALDAGMGVATVVHRRYRGPPEYGSSPGLPPLHCTRRHPDVSGNQCCSVLSGRHGRGILGIRRGRGMSTLEVSPFTEHKTLTGLQIICAKPWTLPQRETRIRTA